MMQSTLSLTSSLMDACRMYVVGKDMAAREVWVVGDEHHPALFTQAAVLHPPLWLEGEAPWQLLQQGQLHCSFMARYNLANRRITGWRNSNTPLRVSNSVGLGSQAGGGSNSKGPCCALVESGMLGAEDFGIRY